MENFSRGRDTLPQPIMTTTLDARGPSRYRAYGEGDDASVGGRTTLSVVLVAAAVVLVWVVTGAVIVLGGV